MNCGSADERIATVHQCIISLIVLRTPNNQRAIHNRLIPNCPRIQNLRPTTLRWAIKRKSLPLKRQTAPPVNPTTLRIRPVYNQRRLNPRF